jgi:N-acetylmuramoyl-L-alanine amidase
VGNKTLKAMGISSSMLSGGSSSTNSKFSSSDVKLLARLIYAEARGEPYQGQVAVGAVVLNRVKSSSFPNTISGVIYQPYAFTCVNDGQINLSPNQTAINAANDAMNGWDPTYGCLYYYNPKVATSKWIYSRKTVVTIGQHVFAL